MPVAEEQGPFTLRPRTPRSGDNAFDVTAREHVPAAVDRLRPLRLVPQSNAGNAEEEGLFLNAAGVGEDDSGRGFPARACRGSQRGRLRARSAQSPVRLVGWPCVCEGARERRRPPTGCPALAGSRPDERDRRCWRRDAPWRARSFETTAPISPAAHRRGGPLRRVAKANRTSRPRRSGRHALSPRAPDYRLRGRSDRGGGRRNGR